MTDWLALANRRIATADIDHGLAVPTPSQAPAEKPWTLVPIVPIVPKCENLSQYPTFGTNDTIGTTPHVSAEDRQNAYSGPFSDDLARLIDSNQTGDYDRWLQACADAERFLNQWGEAAAAFGWTADELFGLHPIAPLARYDAMGLVWLLRGRTVVLIEARAAKLSDRLVWRRKAHR